MSCVNTDYSNTIFYKISCKDENIHDVYIGHTINFIQRKHAHKQCCSNTKSLNYNCKLYQFIRQQGGWDNWNMDIIAFHKCDGLQSAKIYEQKYYDEFNATLNSIEPNPKPKPKLATKMASHDKHIDIIKQTSTKEINTLINRDVNNIFTIDKLFTICSEIIMAQNKDLIEIIMAQNKELVTQNNELVMENEELTTQTEEFMEITKEFNMNLFFDNHFNHDVINIDARFITIPTMGILALIILTKGANLGMKALYLVVALLFTAIILFLVGKSTHSGIEFAMNNRVSGGDPFSMSLPLSSRPLQGWQRDSDCRGT